MEIKKMNKNEEKVKNEEKNKVINLTEKNEPKKVDEIKKMLDAQIHKWEQLSMKIEHREKFLATQSRLEMFSESMKKEKVKGNPETDVYYLKLCSKLSYKEEEAISVNNFDLIDEFLKFINIKISVKVAELEKEIVM